MRYCRQPTTFMEAIGSDPKLDRSRRLRRKLSRYLGVSSSLLAFPIHLASEEIDSPFINSVSPFADSLTTNPIRWLSIVTLPAILPTINFVNRSDYKLVVYLARYARTKTRTPHSSRTLLFG